MSINNSEEDTKSVWKNNSTINKIKIYNKYFPPQPTMKKISQHIPIYIVLHHPYHQ